MAGEQSTEPRSAPEMGEGPVLPAGRLGEQFWGIWAFLGGCSSALFFFFSGGGGVLRCELSGSFSHSSAGGAEVTENQCFLGGKGPEL